MADQIKGEFTWLNYILLEKTFDIKDPNITFSDKVDEEKIKGTKHLVYYGKLTYTPKGCKNCGIVNYSHEDIVKNGTKVSNIKLGQINFKPVLLKLKKQRFFCKHCESTFIAETSLVNRHCFIANPVKTAVAMELRHEQSMKLIGEHMNVSSNTVMRILREVGESLKPHHHYLPEHLGIDEFKSVKNVSGAMSFVFINAVNHEVIDIVENRQQSYLSDYFMRYSLKARLKVKTVTMDMYSPYIGLIEGCFPNAKIIIDRFHIVQHINRALNQVRIQTMNKLRYTQPRDYRKLKKQWKLVLKNEGDLDFNHFFTHRLYDGMVSEYVMANYLIELSPELRDTYILANRLKGAIKRHDFSSFVHLLQETKKRTYPRKVRTVLNTLEKFIDSIENAFKYTLSNGPIEGINNKIKNIKRSGYGYRNFNNLKSRILISFTLTTDNLEDKPLFFKEKEAS